MCKWWDECFWDEFIAERDIKPGFGHMVNELTITWEETAVQGAFPSIFIVGNEGDGDGVACRLVHQKMCTQLSE